MRVAIVLVLLAASSVALADKEHAEHKPCVCAPPKTEKPTIVLEIRWHSASTKRLSKIYSTGMWTLQTTGYGGSHTSGGKLSSDFVDELKAALKAARWKVGKAKSKAECDDDSSATDFYIAGRRRYTQTPCGGAIEESTQKVLERLDRYIQFSAPILPDEEI